MKKGIGSLEVFMTEEDERRFSVFIKQAFPAIAFIDCYPWPDPDLESRIRVSIDQCRDRLNSCAAIWDTSIFPAIKYKEKWINKSISNIDIYHPVATGPGLIQFQHSQEAGYTPGGLRNATLSYSYDAETDTATDDFVKKVLRLCKKNAHKLYVIDPKTGIINEKPNSRFFAWPDAVARYDQVNGMYLTNNTMAYFTTRKQSS